MSVTQILGEKAIFQGAHLAKGTEIVNLDIPAGAEYLAIVHFVTSLVTKRADFSEARGEDIRIAVSEAYINIFRHAYKNCHKGIKRAQIRFLCYPEKLVVVTRDSGHWVEPYFTQEYVKRTDAKKPEKVGLGIFLIKTLMDEVEYDSTISNGTQVRMTKYLRTPLQERSI